MQLICVFCDWVNFLEFFNLLNDKMRWCLEGPEAEGTRRNNNHSKKLSMKGMERRRLASYLSAKGQIGHLHILLHRTCVYLAFLNAPSPNLVCYKRTGTNAILCTMYGCCNAANSVRKKTLIKLTETSI